MHHVSLLLLLLVSLELLGGVVIAMLIWRRSRSRAAADLPTIVVRRAEPVMAPPRMGPLATLPVPPSLVAVRRAEPAMMPPTLVSLAPLPMPPPVADVPMLLPEPVLLPVVVADAEVVLDAEVVPGPEPAAEEIPVEAVPELVAEAEPAEVSALETERALGTDFGPAPIEAVLADALPGAPPPLVPAAPEIEEELQIEGARSVQPTVMTLVWGLLGKPPERYGMVIDSVSKDTLVFSGIAKRLDVIQVVPGRRLFHTMRLPQERLLAAHDAQDEPIENIRSWLAGLPDGAA